MEQSFKNGGLLYICIFFFYFEFVFCSLLQNTHIYKKYPLIIKLWFFQKIGSSKRPYWYAKLDLKGWNVYLITKKNE